MPPSGDAVAKLRPNATSVMAVTIFRVLSSDASSPMPSPLMNLPLALSRPRFLDADTRFVLAVFLGTRLLMLLAAMLLAPHLRPGEPLLDALCRWDCQWYLQMAEHGYDITPNHGLVATGRSGADHPAGDVANWAFFPLYALLVSCVSALVGLSSLTAGFVVSNLALLAGVLCVHRYTSRTLDAATARLVVLLLLVSPLSLYYSVPYTEGLYLALTAATMLAAVSGRWLLAGCAAAALSATRNMGVMIVFPLLAVALSQVGWRAFLRMEPRAHAPIVALLMAPVGLAAFMHFLHAHVGDALAFKHVQIAWDRQLGNPVKQLWWALHSSNPVTLYCAVCGVLAGVSAIWLAIRRRWPEALLVAIGLFIPLSTSVVALPRFTLTLFPVAIALALLVARRPLARRLVPLALVLTSLAYVAAWLSESKLTV